MRSRHTLNITVPLPSILPPRLVLAALQSYTPLLVHNDTVDKFEQVPAPSAVVGDDPFFDGPGSVNRDESVRAFHVWWLIELGHGLRRRWEWPAIMQHSPCGVRFRVLTPHGVYVWAHFTVRPRGMSPSLSESHLQAQSRSQSPASSSTATPVYTPVSPEDVPDDTVTEWELHDELIVEAHRLYMPFVSPYAQRVHQRVCEAIVDDVFKSYVEEAVP